MVLVLVLVLVWVAFLDLTVEMFLLPLLFFFKALGGCRSARTTVEVLSAALQQPELYNRNLQAQPVTLAKLDFTFKMKRKGDMQSQPGTPHSLFSVLL